MSFFLVAYDLQEPKDYGSLGAALRGLKAKEIMKSVWVVPRDGNADSLREYLATYLERSDRLFVTRLAGDVAFRNLLTGNKREGFLTKPSP
jgi:hypothetical protein